MNKQNNKIHFERDWGMFVGSFNDNKFHQHYAVQLSIALEGKINIADKEGSELVSESVIIKSNVPHRLLCETNHVLVLLNPTSQIGHYLQNIPSKSIASFDKKEIAKHKKISE